MLYEYQLVIIAISALIGGAIIAWLIMRPRIAAAFEQGRAELMPELATIKDRFEQREQTLTVTSQRLSEIELRVVELGDEKHELDKQRAVAEQKEKRMQEVIKELEEKEQNLDQLRCQAADQKATIAELNTRIQAERKQAEEKLALLNEAKAELTNQFKILAQNIFEEKGTKFAEQNQIKLDALLNPLRDQLTDFKKKVDDVYVSEAKERASLKQELENLRLLNQQINQEAMNLTRALKGDKKAQGNWGELILERVLEQSGLRKGIEYETQGGFRDADNKLLKPDVIIHLPEGKDVVVDSKVSLSDYERYSSAEDEIEQIEALNTHVQAVRNHIDSLSGKDYSSLKGLRSLDFVLMFIPIEAAFTVAFRHDEKLFSDAFQRKIVVVTPTTLLATLRTIENIWRYERQNQNAQIIAKQAGAVYDKLRGFVEDMEKLGQQLNTVHNTYEDAMGKLTHGKGNLISQANRFVELGVKVKKVLPKSITKLSDM
jgi:DNA recombination protein RmuC